MNSKEAEPGYEYSSVFIDPVQAFYNKFIKFIDANFLTMDLKTYQSFTEKLYKKYATGHRIDFMLADICESCVRISQLRTASRNESTINRESVELSTQQKVWMLEVLKHLKFIGIM